MERRTEAAQLLWSAILRLSGTGGIFEAAVRERGGAGLRSAARKHEVIDACLEGFSTARRAGAVCDFTRDYVPAFAEACLEERSAGLRQGWREQLRRLAPPCNGDVMEGGVMEGGRLPADGMAQGSMAGREDGSSQANGTAGQEEAVPRPAALFQPLSGSAESIQQDAGASSDASDDLLEAAQCLWDAVLPRAVWGEGFDDVAGELGMAELRGHLREPALLATCPEGWQATEERHYDGAFDWGYVPLFLETCIDPKDAALVPGWQAKLAEALEREGNPAPSPLPDGD
ncbi:MAG: hypothetical protein K6C33_12265 [Desulfovibrio sp.]|nr:hypothetical protein [Desulfovibrio sp.]